MHVRGLALRPPGADGGKSVLALSMVGCVITTAIVPLVAGSNVMPLVLVRGACGLAQSSLYPAWYRNFDIILGNVSRAKSQLHTTTHAPCATPYVVPVPDRVLIGAWNPMLCPIRDFRAVVCSEHLPKHVNYDIWFGPFLAESPFLAEFRFLTEFPFLADFRCSRISLPWATLTRHVM